MRNTALSTKPWYIIDNDYDVPSPALMVYPGRIENNIRTMADIAGGTHNLRPHVKTHKMPEIIKLQMKYGINKFKSSTISETEMVARCGAADILLAMQPVGPNINRFFKLQQEFTGTKISCIADSEEVIVQLSEMARQTGLKTHVWVDINNGMNRTGIVPGEKAISLYKTISDSPMLIAEGLHVYDGHIHDPDLSVRQQKCSEAFVPVLSMINELKKTGIGPVKIIAGGSPTFPIHARHAGVETSPGTIVLWDYGSSSNYADMKFQHAAVLLTRIISKPEKDLLCIDLGHKAVASEMPQPRVMIHGLVNYRIINHNEEHMVIRTTDAGNYKTGDLLYAIPWHICPTVDRYDIVTVVNDHRASGLWNVEARKRKITF